jgi:hypothetical protein
MISRGRELPRLSRKVVFRRSSCVFSSEGIAHYAFVVSVIATHHRGATSATTTDIGEGKNYNAEE